MENRSLCERVFVFDTAAPCAVHNHKLLVNHCFFAAFGFPPAFMNRPPEICEKSSVSCCSDTSCIHNRLVSRGIPPLQRMRQKARSVVPRYHPAIRLFSAYVPGGGRWLRCARPSPSHVFDGTPGVCYYHARHGPPVRLEAPGDHLFQEPHCLLLVLGLAVPARTEQNRTQ